MLSLVLGGARSGKSSHSEKKALESYRTLKDKNKKLLYIATAQAGDEQMQKRIQHHQQTRSHLWQTIEEPIELAACIQRHMAKEHVILVDCLTLWLSNLLCQDDKELFNNQRSAFIKTLAKAQGHIILVSNETGLGIIPMGQLSRDFVDEAGFLHQELGRMADEAEFMVAGFATRLK